MSHFNLGDKVTAFGVTGIVVRINADKMFPILVQFDSSNSQLFTAEGRALRWHVEPSLTLVRRAAAQLRLLPTPNEDDAAHKEGA